MFNVPIKTTIPILTRIKLVASEEGLRLTGSDSEVSIEVFLPIEDEELQLTVQEPGSIVLLLVSLEKSLKNYL